MTAAAAPAADRFRRAAAAMAQRMRRWDMGWSARAVFLCAVLAAVCLRGLFGPGYVLQVDFAFGPVCPGPTWDFNAPVTALFSGLCDIVGGAVAGRVYAFGALFLCSFAPMVVLRRARWYAQCAAGILGAMKTTSGTCRRASGR